MFTIKRMRLDRDDNARSKWENLMQAADLNIHEEIDYTVGIYKKSELVATGSYAHNIIKCLAVCKDYQSENLLTQLVVHLMNRLQQEGHHHYFVYTSPQNSIYFKSMGFKIIIQTEDLAFMEFGTPHFKSYLELLSNYKKEGNNGAIVMNANPFTKGHRYLIEEAAEKSDYVYMFVLSEDRSEFSAEDRMNMVKLGVADLDNVIVLPTRDYMVSSATFPSYFLRNDAMEEIARVQANLDAQLFKEKIAPVLNIKYRFVGEEPYSTVTNIYNESMSSIFQDELTLFTIPRKEVNGEIISATKVRKMLTTNAMDKLNDMVPETTYNYIQTLKEDV